MARPRVHEVAAALGLTSAATVERLRELGEFVSGPSSVIEIPTVKRLYTLLGRDYVVTGGNFPEANSSDTSPTSARSRLAEDPTAPSARQFGWHANPVPPSSHPTLVEKLDRATRAFPALQDHRAALQRLGSQVTSIPRKREPALEDGAIALVRFSGAIESAFGLTREVLFAYTPYRDLQQRTFDAAFAQLKQLPREVANDVVFLWAPDPRLRVKLAEWSRPGQLAVPLDFDTNNDASLISLLREFLHLRDLFFETTPVSGTKYFGRRTLLRSLREDVLAQRVTGLFGLRKAGKTSTLLQLAEDLREDNVVSILVDLESFPSPPEDPVDDVLFAIKTRLAAKLKEQGRRSSQLSNIGPDSTILQFKTAMQALLRKQGADGVKILLMLDEIEYLTPSDQIDIREGAMPRISQLLAALRSVVQESPNFTFLLSGLTSAIVESGRLYGRPNPLFSWAKPTYISPLDRSEADDLAITIGARMGVEIDPGALEALHQASGGHAYLYRHLASTVVKSLNPLEMERRLSRATVLHQLEPWSRAVSGHVEEMVRHVERYYPLESLLLQLIREGDSDTEALAREEPGAIQHLIDLGLTQFIDGRYVGSVLLDLR